MAGTELPSASLDGVTPRVDTPAGINVNFRGNNPLEFTNDLNFSNIDVKKYSKYFKPYGGVFANTPLSINEFVAQVQTPAEKWANGIVKFGGKVGTSFLEPFVDFTYGAASAISQGQFSKLFDNEITNSFDRFNDYLAENFPNYYTEREQSSPTFSPHNWFTANFWSDKVLGGAAFTVGTLLNAYATMGIGTALKGTQLGLKAGNTAAKAALASADDLGKIGKRAIQDLVRQGQAYKFRNGAEALSASLFSVTGEAGLEARELGKTLRSELQPLVERGHISQSEADSRVENAMATAFASNVAIVGTSQFLQFGKLFQRGYRPNKVRLNNIVKDGEKFAQKLPQTGFGKFAYKTTGARIAVRDMLTEAKEEGLQYLTQKTLEDKYGEEIIKDNISSLTTGIKELFGTKEGQENMLIGAILGTGSHVGKLIGTNKSEPYNQARQNATGKVIDLLNKHFTKNDNLLEKLVSNAGTQVAATERKEAYLAEDDIFNYKNEEAKEFAAVVKSFADLGALDILQEQIDAFGKMSQEEFSAFFDPYKDTGVSKNKEEYIKEIKNKIARYSKIYQSIEDRFADRLPAYRSGLYFSAIAVEDLANREITIKNEIKNRTGIDYTDFANLRTRQYYERAKDKIKKTAGQGEQKEEEKIPTENKEIFDEAFTSAVNDWLKDHGEEVSEEEVKNIAMSISDLANITTVRQSYLDNYNYLLSEKGQKNTKTEEVQKEAEGQLKEQDQKLYKDLEAKLEEAKAKKITPEDLDKAVSDALRMYKYSGNKKYKKIADELIAFMPEDKKVKAQADDSTDSSSPTGNKVTDKVKKVTKQVKDKAKEIKNKRETKRTKADEIASEDINEELAKTNLSDNTLNQIVDAINIAKEQADETNSIEDDTSYNSAKRIPVEEESNGAEESLTVRIVKAFESLFNPKGQLKQELGPEKFFDFEFMMKLFREAYRTKTGNDIDQVLFNIIKGQFISSVHSANPNPHLYEAKINKFTYNVFNNSKFHADNAQYITTAKGGKITTKLEEASLESNKHDKSEDSYSTMHSSLGFLSRAYKVDEEGNFQELSNDLVQDNNLNYDEVNESTEVTLRIPETIQYEVDRAKGEAVTVLQKHKKGEKLTEEELKKLPIEIVDSKGNVLGMLHTEKWVDDKISYRDGKYSQERHDKYADVIGTQQGKLNAIRNLVYQSGPIQTTISRRTNGRLILNTENGIKKQITATTALQDESLQFAIGVEHLAEGQLRLKPNVQAQSEGIITNDMSKIIPGITYALLPVNKDSSGNIIYTAAPMQSMRPRDYKPQEGAEKTSETTIDLHEFAKTAVNSSISAIEIYLNRDNLTPEQIRLAAGFKGNGYDITTYKGLRDYIKNFFYTFDNINELSEDRIGGPLKEYLKGSVAGNFVLNINPNYVGIGETGSDNFYLARVYPKGKGSSTHNMGVDESRLTQQNKIDQKTFLNELRRNLNEQYFRTDLNKINRDGEFSVPLVTEGQVELLKFDNYNHYAKHLLRSDVLGVQDENGHWIYSIQPIIEFNSDFIADENISNVSEDKKLEQKIDNTEKKEDNINTEGLSDELKHMLDQYEDSEFDENEEDGFNSIKRSPSINNLEERFGVRHKNGSLKTYPKTKYDELTQRVKQINEEIAKFSEEHKAKVLTIRKGNRTYAAIQIVRTSRQQGMFDSFKRTKEKAKKETLGRTITGDIMISNLPLHIQNSTIDNISSELLDRARRASESDQKISEKQIVKDSIDTQYNAVVKMLSDLNTALEANPNNKRIVKLIEHLTTVQNNFEALANMAIRQMSASNIINSNRFKISIKENKTEVKEENFDENDIDKLNERSDDIDDNADGLSDLEDNNEDTTLWEAEGSLKIDTKKTISKELKRALTDIRAYNKDGTPAKNFYGKRVLVPFDVVYNTVTRILSGKLYYGKDALNQMIQELEKHSHTAPFLKDVIAKLKYESKNPNSKVPYQFQRAMIKHRVNMFYLGFNYRKGKEGGRRRFFIFPVDSNSVYNGKVISDNWFNTFILSEYVSVDEDLADNVLTKKSLNNLRKKSINKTALVNIAYNKFLQNPENEKLRNNLYGAIDDALSLIGVDLEDGTINDIIDGRLYYSGNNVGVNALFQIKDKTIIGKNKEGEDILAKSNGQYNWFISSLSKVAGAPLSTKNPFSHNFIKSLAEHDSKYNNIDISNSMKDRTGKTIYTYSNFKYLIERAIKLIDNPYVDEEQKTKLLDQLSKVPFISNSGWLQQLKDGDLNASNFEIKYADAIVNFNKQNEGIKVKDAPIADIELYKLGLFMNRGFTDGSDRSVTYVYPTLSDGGTIMEVSALAEEIVLNDNNTLGQGTLDKMFEALVMPEVNRIRDFQSKGETNLKGYDEGANHFLFLPKMNDSDLGLFEDGKLKKEFTQEDLDNIYELLNNYATNLIKNKIDEWIDYGVLRHSNAVIASKPIVLNKEQLITQEDIDNLHTWSFKGSWYLRDQHEINKVIEGTEYKPTDVVYVYETDDTASLNSNTGRIAEKMFNLENGNIGLKGQTYGLATKPNVEESEYEIKDKQVLIDEVRKLASVAEKNPEKLFIINLELSNSPSRNFSGYNGGNLAQIFANVKLPKNIALKESFSKQVIGSADWYRKKDQDYLNELHEKAKRATYKNNSLYFVDEQYYDKTFGEDNSSTLNRPYYVAANYVINYMIANANIHQLFIGDPALYYKKSKQEGAGILEHAMQTFDNISKRLAGDRAPGEFIADSFDPSENYNQLFIPDRILASEAASYMASLGYSYDAVNGSDAQELTTLKEDLYIRYKAGMISKALYDALYHPEKGIVTKELAKGNHDYYPAIEGQLKTKLLEEFREVINQPMKPVYVNNITQEINGQQIDRRIYIKSSAFALDPRLTKNKQLDKLRIYMEKNGVDRVAFESAVKVGDFASTENIKFFNEDGSINIDEEALNSNIINLTRDGFRIQQDIPFREDKTKVKFGVQESALLFNNILDEVIGDTSVRDIKSEYDEAYHKLYKLAAESVYKELGLKPEEIFTQGFNRANKAKISEKKLSKLLETEAINRGYSKNEIEALGISKGQFNLRLAFHTRGLSLESVLISIINNRVIKQKFYGKGFILGTQEGFKYLEDKDIRDRVIYTKDVVDELKPMGFVNKETGEYVDISKANDENVVFQPAQVFVPSILKTEDGKSIDLFEKENGKWKYLIKKQNRLVLNNNTVDPDILKMFGFRIPTQGHNSMAYIEIAGFLPKQAGDLIIAPRDFTKQMGSDFDVDKLYTYMYNIRIENGKIKKIDSNEDSKEGLRNKILDAHFKVLSASNAKIQKQIFEPLGFGLLKSDPGQFKSSNEEITKIVNEEFESNLGNYIQSLNDVSDREFTGLSDMYQRDTFLEGRDGAVGIGAFSLNSVLNAALQNTTMTTGKIVRKEGEEEFVKDEIYFGDSVSNDAYQSQTHDEKYDKSQVISWYQSASVDNAKEKILFKLNINSDTMPVIAYLNQIGFHEEVIWFINQPIIRDYVKQRQISNSILNVGDDHIDRVDEAIHKKYHKSTVDKIKKIDGNKINFKDGRNYSIDNLHEALKLHKSGKVANMKAKDVAANNDAIMFYKSQLALLDLFKEYEKSGRNIQNLQNVLNSNSKGSGKTLSEAHIKANEIINLSQSQIFDGADQLVGDYITQRRYNNMSEKEREGYIYVGEQTYIKPTTIQGYASIYGTIASSYLFNSMFPYSSEPIAEAMDLITDISGYKSESISARAKNVNKIWNELKKFINSKALADTATTIPLRTILLDNYIENGENTRNQSLATIISKIKSNKQLSGNTFIEGLKVKSSKKANKFSIITFNNTVSDNISDEIVYQDFARLIYDPKSLGEINGIPYDTKKLAEDLIKYSLMAGGVQQFSQFIKYVPFSYLEAIGYNDVINSIDFENPGIIGKPLTGDYSNTPEFVTQYFQHNPELVPEIHPNNPFVHIDPSTVLADVRTFSIDTNPKGRTKTKLMRSRKDEDNDVLVEFIKIRNYDTKQLQLYKLIDPLNGRYVRISTLGSNGVSEYNFNQQFEDTFKTSILENGENEIVTKRYEHFDDIFEDDAELTRIGKKYNIYSGNASSILNNIVKDIESKENLTEQERMNGVLAKELSKLTETFTVPIIVDSSIDSEGKYNPNTNTIRINDEYIANLPNADEAFQRVFLHEYLHAITVRIIKEDPGNPHLSSLQGIITQTKEALSKGGINIEAILKKAKVEKSITAENAKYLGLQNEAEFISEFMTNPEFREVLKEIKYEDKTLYERFIETIINLLNSFGLSIPKGTAAEAGFQNVLAIIDISSDGDFYNSLVSSRNPVGRKSIDPVEALRSTKFSFKSEEEFDSIVRDLINQDRIEIACKL